VARLEKPMSSPSTHDRWARFRFLIVGPLLAAPPARAQLRPELVRLARTPRPHPITGELICFGVSTIERWYYQARAATDPIAVLRRKPRLDRGRFVAINIRFAAAVRDQYRHHPSWSVTLHRDNLKILADDDPSLGSPPSYSTMRRYMARHGLKKVRRHKGRRAGEVRACDRIEKREVRSYEAKYVQGLWHLDFHHGSRKILTPDGEWRTPILLAILDDRSRLICHAQWFLDESAESLIHGIVQAILKRGSPRALLTDNGGAMLAAETTEGFVRLSILHETTLPYSPYQNGKQEVFWTQVEGRLIAMLEGEKELSLALLNRATLAWVEREYNRSKHSETNQKPLDRWLDGPSVGRPSPTLEALRFAFTTRQIRTQRHSDGTISLAGQRFEIPDRFRHLHRLTIRLATWDLRRVWIVDEHSGLVLDQCMPLDRTRNADGFRKPRHDAGESACSTTEPTGIAPLLNRLMQEYAATGLPPAYIPTESS
jgi:transposase InsO family protein